jgi:hypothetical protein
VRKPLFRPLTLGLMGLAFAVTLWGFAYKISLYSNSSDPLPHLPEAKVWIEHRYGFAAEFRFTAVEQKPGSNLDFGPQVLPSLMRAFLLGSRRALFEVPLQRPGTRFYYPFLSPRSPPLPVDLRNIAVV